jgi:hypothetical protein
MAYLVYHASENDQEKNLPIAAAMFENDARSLGIRTVLQLGWTDGGISVVKNDTIDAEDIEGINLAVKEYLAGHRTAA